MTASPDILAEGAKNSGLPSEEEIARLLCAREGYDPDLKASHEGEALLWSEWLDDARAILDLIRPAMEAKERATVKRIAEVASQVSAQAGVGASETAGLIVSVLAANPEHTERFMAEGSELFIDGTIRPENGCLSHMAMNGQVVSPTKLREMKGQSQ